MREYDDEAPGWTPAIPRRLLLTAAAGWTMSAGDAVAAFTPGTTAPDGVPSDRALQFQVSRNGNPIGTHCLSFRQDGSDMTVRIDAEFRVGFGFITFYRYRHQGTEIWRDGRFASLHTITNDNGAMFEVNAKRTAGGVQIAATKLADRTAPDGALPLTHWSLAGMTAPLFNPQTGEMVREICRPQGAGLVRLADGRPIQATGYQFKGEVPIEDWYDTSKIWAALNAIGKDGSQITYRRA